MNAFINIFVRHHKKYPKGSFFTEPPFQFGIILAFLTGKKLTFYYFLVMKNKLTAILALFLCTTFANAQDLIQLKSGKTEEVQILEINKEKVKFKKFKNLNGPTYSVRLEKVATIKYENGMTMNLGAVDQPVAAPVPEPAPAPQPEAPAPQPDAPEFTEPLMAAAPDSAPEAEPQVQPAPDSSLQQQESGFVQETAPQQEAAFVPEPAPQPEPELVEEPEPVAEPTPEPKPEPEPKAKKKKKKAPVVVVAEEEPEEAKPEETKTETAESKKDSTEKKPYGSVGLSFIFGMNLLTDVEKPYNSESIDLDFFSPVTLLELDFLLGSKFGLLFGSGFMFASTSDPNMGWLQINQRYNSNQSGDIFMMPLYGGIKLHLGDTGALHPFGKAYLGYTFMWADDPILDPIGSSYYGYYNIITTYAYGGFLWGFAIGIENPSGPFLEAGLMMFDGGVYSKYRYNGYTQVSDSEMDFMFVNVKIGFRF